MDAAHRGATALVESGQNGGPIQAMKGQETPDAPERLPGHGGGAEMPADVRAKMEGTFGVDLSRVRIHEGSNAQAIGALAYTQGTNIHFAPGQYRPGSQRGQELLGHELAHVVQQSQGRVQATTQAKGVDINDDTFLEREADEIGARAARGEAGPKPSPATRLAEGLATVQMWKDPRSGPTRAEIAAAIRFNKNRSLPGAAWKQIASIIGAASEAINEDLVRKLGEWQTSKNLEADGRAGDVTLQWLSQQPGGKGLDAHVKSNATIYLGMNPAARVHESDKLKQQLGGDVESLLGSNDQDHVEAGAANADLTTPEGRKAFVGSLPGLDPSRATNIEAFLAASGGNTRDELAQLVKLMHEAETGKRLIKRVVLSGHSGGWSVVGESPNDGSISFHHLATLSGIFPMAVGQVEDLMLSACNTGQKSKLTQYTKIFPNLKSIWAYVGYSPSPPGSSQHIAQWEKSSRGAMNPATLNAGRKEVAKGKGKLDENVLVWTRDDAGAETYDTASPELDYASLRDLVDDKLPHFEAAFNDGKINRPALDDLYTDLQNLVGNHRGALGADADKYERIMRQTLFLRYWTKVSSEFMKRFGSRIQRAYQAAAAKMPPYASATRENTLRYISAYPGKAGDEAHRLLQDYLRDLKPDLIPDTWF